MFTTLARFVAKAAQNANPPPIKTYPFSKGAIIHPEPYRKPPESLRRGRGLMAHLYKTLPTPEKQTMIRKLFSRKSSDCLMVGSIVSVITEQSPGTFTGVLLAIRRRGPDSTIMVRNVVQRMGVEVQFFVNSPLVKDIKVLKRPPKGRMRKAKLYYLRDSPQAMSMLAASSTFGS